MNPVVLVDGDDDVGGEAEHTDEHQQLQPHQVVAQQTPKRRNIDQKNIDIFWGNVTKPSPLVILKIRGVIPSGAIISIVTSLEIELPRNQVINNNTLFFSTVNFIS